MHLCNVVKVQRGEIVECGIVPRVLDLTHMGNLGLFRRFGDDEWSASFYRGRVLVARATGPLCFLLRCRFWLESDDLTRRRALLTHLALADEQPANTNA